MFTAGPGFQESTVRARNHPKRGRPRQVKAGRGRPGKAEAGRGGPWQARADQGRPNNCIKNTCAHYVKTKT